MSATDAVGSSVGCSRLADIRNSGTYTVLAPVDTNAEPLVVGILPVGKGAATVRAANRTADTTVRGRLFLATLPIGALGEGNAVPVSVEYEE